MAGIGTKDGVRKWELRHWRDDTAPHLTGAGEVAQPVLHENAAIGVCRIGIERGKCDEIDGVRQGRQVKQNTRKSGQLPRI
jgi:hypothetical protein